MSLDFLKFSLSFYRNSLKELGDNKIPSREIKHQLFENTGATLGVVAVCLAFTGMMLVVEFSYHMKLILSQDSLVGPFSAVLVIRELGPVLTALLIASRVGASQASEIAVMKSTEQIDAMRLMGVDVIGFLGAPRLIGSVFGCLVLTMLSLAVGILGGGYLASAKIGIPFSEFSINMFFITRPIDLVACIFKSILFGFVIPLAPCFYGLRAQPNSEGVGLASTQSVVSSMVLILILDFIVTALQRQL